MYVWIKYRIIYYDVTGEVITLQVVEAAIVAATDYEVLAEYEGDLETPIIDFALPSLTPSSPPLNTSTRSLVRPKTTSSRHASTSLLPTPSPSHHASTSQLPTPSPSRHASTSQLPRPSPSRHAFTVTPRLNVSAADAFTVTPRLNVSAADNFTVTPAVYLIPPDFFLVTPAVYLIPPDTFFIAAATFHDTPDTLSATQTSANYRRIQCSGVGRKQEGSTRYRETQLGRYRAKTERRHWKVKGSTTNTQVGVAQDEITRQRKRRASSRCQCVMDVSLAVVEVVPFTI